MSVYLMNKPTGNGIAKHQTITEHLDGGKKRNHYFYLLCDTKDYVMKLLEDGTFWVAYGKVGQIINALHRKESAYNIMRSKLKKGYDFYELDFNKPDKFCKSFIEKAKFINRREKELEPGPEPMPKNENKDTEPHRDLATLIKLFEIGDVRNFYSIHRGDLNTIYNMFNAIQKLEKGKELLEIKDAVKRVFPDVKAECETLNLQSKIIVVGVLKFYSDIKLYYLSKGYRESLKGTILNQAESLKKLYAIDELKVLNTAFKKDVMKLSNLLKVFTILEKAGVL